MKSNDSHKNWLILFFSCFFLFISITACIVIMRSKETVIEDDEVPLSLPKVKDVSCDFYLDKKNKSSYSSISYLSCTKVGSGTITNGTSILDDAETTASIIISAPDVSSYETDGKVVVWRHCSYRLGKWHIIGTLDDAPVEIISEEAIAEEIMSNESIAIVPETVPIAENTSANTFLPETDGISTFTAMEFSNLVFQEGDTCTTTGFYQAGDGGSATYKISAEGNIAENQRTSFLLKNGLYANLILEDTMSVKQFGAVGDGTTNDAYAVLCAINNRVTELTFPAGNFNLYNTPMEPTYLISLRGLDKNSTTLSNVYFTCPNGIQIDGITFNLGSERTVLAPDTSYTSNIMFVTTPASSSQVSYKNCRFENTDFVSFASSANTYFQSDIAFNCEFNNIGRVAIYHSVKSNYSEYNNNSFTNIGNDTLNTGAVAAIWLGDVTNNTSVETTFAVINNNTFHTLATADDLDPNSKHIINANFISVRADVATIDNNTISDLLGYGNDRESVYTKVRNLTISNNTITNGGFGEGYICCKGHSGDLITNISGNVLAGDGGCGIIVYGPSTIENNQITIANCSSAITVSKRSDYSANNPLVVSNNVITCGTANTYIYKNSSIANYSKMSMINIYSTPTDSTIKGNVLNPTTPFNRYIKIDNITSDIHVLGNTINAINFSGEGISIFTSNSDGNEYSTIDINDNTLNLVANQIAVKFSVQGNNNPTFRTINFTNNTFTYSKTNTSSYVLKCYNGTSNNDILNISQNTCNVSKKYCKIAYTVNSINNEQDDFATLTSKE